MPQYLNLHSYRSSAFLIAWMFSTNICSEVSSPPYISQIPNLILKEPERISLTWTPRQCKAKKPTWRRLGMKTTGLVVKDVICLPYKTYLKRNDLYYVPNNRERDMLASLGLVARITIDSCWLSEEMEGRLASLFKHRFCRSHAEKFQFTYLQVPYVCLCIIEKMSRPILSL